VVTDGNIFLFFAERLIEMKIRFLTGIVVVNLALISLPLYPFGQQSPLKSEVPSKLLKAFLRTYLNPGQTAPDMTTRINVVSVPTATEASGAQLVYVSGEGWCGSGGCTLLIVVPSATSFKVVGRVTVVQLPVYLLPSTKHGYPDIGVCVRGVSVGSEYEAELSYNGVSYPGNPTVPPARPLNGIKGKEIIATTRNSVPLYK
jgi:hypothetical protein